MSNFLQKAIQKIGNLINNQALIRAPHSVKKYYKKGLSRPIIEEKNGKSKLIFSNNNKIAVIWEKGFNSYNYGRRVLENPLNKIRMSRSGNKYIRLLMNKGNTIRTLSEKTLRNNTSAWIMPKRYPENAYKRAWIDNRKTIKKMIQVAIKKDFISKLGRK